MSTPATLPMSGIVNVVVNVSPQSPTQPTFNQGLVVGPSSHISPGTRIKQYTTLAQMLTDGFLVTDPEYIAASLYFGQSQPPQTLWVGRHDSANESCLQAVIACQAANPSWWAVYVTDAVKSDHQAIALWAQSASPSVCYFYNTADSDVPLNTPNNVMDYMKTNALDRAFGVYTTNQNGNAPNNDYIGADAMGMAMGLNTGLANSFFTAKFKMLPGTAAEPLDPTSIGNIEGLNGNLYLSYANAYTFLEQGKVASGRYFDEILNLDMLASAIQYSIMNLFVSNPSIPQTDAGQTMLLHAVNQACEAARVRGFLAGGVWTGPSILKLSTGDPVPNGYVAMSDKYANQLPSDRQARKAMPIYCCVVEAGAVHSVQIQVNVQR